MLLHTFVVILHDCQLETGRCTVHADIDRAELPSWMLFNADFWTNISTGHNTTKVF